MAYSSKPPLGVSDCLGLPSWPVRIPHGPSLEDGVENEEELTHGGGERELGRLAGGAQAFVEGSDLWIAAGVDERVVERIDQGDPRPREMQRVGGGEAGIP